MKNPLYSKFLLLVSLLLVSGEINAQKNKDSSLLWEISGNGLPESSYLFGTIHLADKPVNKYHKQAIPTFEKCKGYAMELIPDITSAGNPMDLLKQLQMTDKTLKDLYTEKEYERLSTYFEEKLKTPLDNFQSMKPFFLYSLIAQSQMGSEMMDMNFYKMAKAQSKDVFGLETMDEQLSALGKGMTLEQQAEMLLKAADEGGGRKSESKMMLRYYKKGDLDKLQEMGKEDEMFDANFEETMVFSRNHIMAERLVPLIKEQSTFVAVGALHLVGEEGVVALLRKEGYTMTPIH